MIRFCSRCGRTRFFQFVGFTCEPCEEYKDLSKRHERLKLELYESNRKLRQIETEKDQKKVESGIISRKKVRLNIINESPVPPKRTIDNSSQDDIQAVMLLNSMQNTTLSSSISAFSASAYEYPSTAPDVQIQERDDTCSRNYDTGSSNDTGSSDCSSSSSND